MNILASSKYTPTILVFIYEYRDNSYCSHNEICEALDIKKNNLSNIIKRLESEELFDIKRVGRNKYYCLSDKGIAVYRSLFDRENRFYYRNAKEMLRK